MNANIKKLIEDRVKQLEKKFVRPQFPGALTFNATDLITRLEDHESFISPFYQTNPGYPVEGLPITFRSVISNYIECIAIRLVIARNCLKYKSQEYEKHIIADFEAHLNQEVGQQREFIKRMIKSALDSIDMDPRHKDFLKNNAGDKGAFALKNIRNRDAKEVFSQAMFCMYQGSSLSCDDFVDMLLELTLDKFD